MEGKGIPFLFFLGILEHIVAQEHRNTVEENHAILRTCRTNGVLRLKRSLVCHPVGGAACLMKIDALAHLLIVDLRRRNVGNLRPMRFGTVRGVSLGKC